MRAVHQVEEPSGGKPPEGSMVTDPRGALVSRAYEGTVTPALLPAQGIWGGLPETGIQESESLLWSL